MKKNYLFLIILLNIILLISFVPDNCKIKYNGIYAIKLDEEHSAVLRFYEDGTVLASSSVNDYIDVMSWFNKDNKDMVLKGTYKIKQCAIKFKVSGMTGEQSYEGEIQGDNLNFELKNKDSKKGIRRTYSFHPL